MTKAGPNTDKGSGEDSPAKKSGKAANNNPESVKKEFNKKAPKPEFGGYLIDPDRKRIKLTAKRFIITSAQNNTPVNEGFFNALETYARENDSQLIVSRFTYNKNAYENSANKKTPGARQNLTKGDADDLTYDKRIKPYILDESAEIAKGLVFGGNLNILPTAVNPMSGFENYFRKNSGILPHVQHAMKSLPGMKEDGARFLYTTGTCTKRNYIQQKAGQKAEAQHVYGALVVEVDEVGDWFVRQIAADDKGAFYDLDKKYLPSGKVLHDQRIEAITWGDIHVEKIDPAVKEISIGKGGILDTLNPHKQFIHDLPDFTSRSHHNIKDPFFRHDQFHNKKLSVEGTMSLCAEFLKAAERPKTKTYVIEGNHDRHMIKWLQDDKNIENDPLNAAFFHACKSKIFSDIELNKDSKAPRKIFEWAVRKKAFLPRTEFLETNTSFRICKDAGGDSEGIECNLHGDIGPNGSRASPRSFISLGVKSNTAHTHTAGITSGVYTAGVMGLLDMGYNEGPSSWSHSNIITYPNGKRAIVTLKNGKWRAAKTAKAAAVKSAVARTQNRKHG